MKIIEFQPLREKRQEYYNIEDYELLDYDFNRINKKVYINANLSIFLDDHCNADCKFCVAQLRFENKGQIYDKCKITSDEEYFARLEEVLKYLKPLNLSVSITGGEPTKSKRLPRTLQLINKYELRKRVITTNGSGLLDLMEGKQVIQHIVDNKFSHLNISRTHYDEDINKRIMAYDTGYCSNEDIKTILAYSKANNLRPRMSCLLLKEGIHTLKDVVKYMDFYQNLGLDNVIFRELMGFSEDMNNDVKKEYCNDNKIDLNNLWSEIDKDIRFAPVMNLIGYYYYVEVYKYKNIDMCSESANLVKIDDEKEKHKDIIYEMIFHPNGNLNGSWVDNEDILLPY